MGCRIPDSRTGRADFGHSRTPDDLPVSAAAAAADATVDGRQRRGGETDGLLRGVWLMNAHGTGWRRAGAIPPRVVHVEAGVGHVVQFDEGKIDVGFRRAKGGPALILRQRAAAALAAGGRLVIPIHHDAGSVASIETAVIGR